MKSIREDLQDQVDKLRAVRSETGMTRIAFSEYMGIPLRNLEDWEAGRRKMPDYLLRLIAYYNRMERYLNEKHIEIKEEWYDAANTEQPTHL